MTSPFPTWRTSTCVVQHGLVPIHKLTLCTWGSTCSGGLHILHYASSHHRASMLLVFTWWWSINSFYAKGLYIGQFQFFFVQILSISSLMSYQTDSNHQPGECSAPGWSFATLQCLCQSDCLSVCHSLGRPGNELMVAAVMYGCFELAGLFASSLQKEAKQCQYYRQ